MSTEVTTESFSLVQRITLLSLVRVAAEGGSDSITVKNASEEVLERVDAEVIGSLSEQQVIRALRELAAEPFIEEHRSDRSPTGKGRPTYVLDAGPGTVLDALAEDDRLAAAVEAVRDSD